MSGSHDSLKAVERWDFETVTTETKLVLHANLREVVAEANQSGLRFRLYRKMSPREGFVETVVLQDVAFQSDGKSIRQGVWDDRLLIITGEGVFALNGEEAD